MILNDPPYFPLDQRCLLLFMVALGSETSTLWIVNFSQEEEMLVQRKCYSLLGVSLLLHCRSIIWGWYITGDWLIKNQSVWNWLDRSITDQMYSGSGEWLAIPTEPRALNNPIIPSQWPAWPGTGKDMGVETLWIDQSRLPPISDPRFGDPACKILRCLLLSVCNILQDFTR